MCEQQPEAATRVRSTVLPSAGATPRLRGSAFGSNKTCGEEGKCHFLKKVNVF